MNLVLFGSQVWLDSFIQQICCSQHNFIISQFHVEKASKIQVQFSLFTQEKDEER